MSTRPDPKSPWGVRIWIPDSDFDLKMDAARALVSGNLFEPGRGVDVDSLLMRAYQVNPDFTDSLSSECLGRTNFLADGRFHVEVSRALADEAVHSRVARRRLRSTLAHECAHIVLHSVMHPVWAGPALFEEMTVRAPVVMCREPRVDATGIEWWELQANRGMGSLLMPRAIVKEQLGSWLENNALASVSAALAARKGEALVRGLADVFDVNLPVVVYRLQELGFVAKSVGQGDLAFEER